MAARHISLAALLQDEQLPDIPLTSLALDSRETGPGCLFFAYPGYNQDRRQYVSEAIRRGAAAIIYEAGAGYMPPAEQKVFLLPRTHVREMVGKLAARFYNNPSERLRVIGVTGTNGKTSITHFVAQALAQAHCRCAVFGTLGVGELPVLQESSHTTPDPIKLQCQLAALEAQGITDVAMEVSSHALHQARVAGVQFTTAVFTQLSRDHLDYHGDLISYAKAKELLFVRPEVKHAVINADDEFGRVLIERYHRHFQLVSYSLRPIVPKLHDFVIAERVMPQQGGFNVCINSSWGRGELTVNLLGSFNLSNLLAVLAVLLVNGLSFERALACCSQLQAPKGRMQVLGTFASPTVVVDYAHTPDALEKALIALKAHCQGKLWCVFGCGGDRDKGKRPLMGAVAEKWSDYIIITDDNPRHESPSHIAAEIKAGVQAGAQVKVILNRAEAIQTVVQSAKNNDIVLIAGKGHECSQIVGDQAFPFDDVLQVKQALGERN